MDCIGQDISNMEILNRLRNILKIGSECIRKAIKNENKLENTKILKKIVKRIKKLEENYNGLLIRRLYFERRNKITS